MNPQTIFEDLIHDFIKAGIPIEPASIDPFLRCSNSLTRLGSCKKENGIYSITLSQHAMKDAKQIRNTLAHELVHTLPRCMNHGKTFHKYGLKAARRAPQFSKR